MTSDSATELIRRWQEGDEEAARALYQQYAARLIALARSRLSARIAVRVDAEDVVQSVCRSFFLRLRDGRLVLQRGCDLWQLLVALTLNKLHRQVKFHQAGKRAVGRELTWPGTEEAIAFPVALVSREPTPDEAFALTEMLDGVLSDLRPLDQRIVELRLQGQSVEEIAVATERSERTIWRVLERVKQQIADWS